MSPFRILVVDDEPDIRKVVALSLSRDPAFTVRTCATGQEGIEEAADWLPNLILLDVMMPTLDGPATLALLRQRAATARIPVVFLTARAGSEELDRLAALGASGAIAKPFAPKALRQEVRRHLGVHEPSAAIVESGSLAEPLASEQDQYRTRLRSDADKLVALRRQMCTGPHSEMTADELRTIAHKLAGSAGIFGFAQVSGAAAALENAIAAIGPACERREDIMAGIDRLLEGIERA
jgi:CheY-like chemotaxis protein/HPt (histidine-containing phosphotransfer) domain-containing protein